MNQSSIPSAQGLYDPVHEHDACGVGFVAHIKGQKSHAIVRQGLQILENLTHRGATGADPLAGDGAGILLQIPDAFLRRAVDPLGFALPEVGHYAVGMVFLPQDPQAREICETILERCAREEGAEVLGWRTVPTQNQGLGDSVKRVEPFIRQIFLARGATHGDQTVFERKLFVLRKRAEHEAAQKGYDRTRFYLPSLSSRTLIYKGMLLADQVGQYYTDLNDESLVSALALVHQRFSTNTFPTWDLAHPFRLIAHNGEINTLRGNVNWMAARRGNLASALLGEDVAKIWPLIVEGQSDSAAFDNALELLVAGGYSLVQAMTLLIPEAWAGNPLMDEARRDYYEYHAALMEPWDGPAAVAFTDGRQIGATLDRNGLRPARYLQTSDDLVLMASEMGVLPIPEHKIIKKWRLQPGKMFLIDLEQGRIVSDAEVKSGLARQHPYRQWLEATQIRLEALPVPAPAVEEKPTAAVVLHRQQAFGMTEEELKFILAPMVTSGQEAVGSMGDDTPLAVLSNRSKSLYQYFRQLFAQVTNPPIDPIREELVMSLVSFIGPRPNLLAIHEADPQPRLEVEQPVLLPEDMSCLRAIASLTADRFRVSTLSICAPLQEGVAGLAVRLEALCTQAVEAVRSGSNILILSDRSVGPAQVAIPALLATAAVHHYLVREGLRTATGLVVETGSAREVHHFALLVGYGAEAVYPWLVYETLEQGHGAFLNMDVPLKEMRKRFSKAVSKGLLKVMSKMGISTVQSYCGAQIFEAIGLSASFVRRFFTGTASVVEGIGLAEILEENLRLHRVAYSAGPLHQEALDAGGEYAYRIRGEAHMWTPESISKLQHATRSGNYATYQEYARAINDQAERWMTLRGLFEFKNAAQPLPISEVEAAASIVKRFATGAMSLGSISQEAHSTLAVAMNRLGGKSNTGEGGEDPARFRPLSNGDSMRSAIKQVASGRFGVTAEYLVNADDIQIKMAQGAKPGEGGQLPGHKVSQYIGKLRHSVPGVGLISPPPHHDIYSIEDLAQLIHDLKNVNPQARISVKLVSEVGVGTVAAGVAKAHADHVTISGHDGGTGASPLSSIKYAGSPWELGLAETQQTLVLNRLRGRICVQADGQMKTGRDVVIGALLGADEFGFATAPLVVEGCIMMRKCHLNTCPVGIATQDPELTRRFAGQPEHLINYFFFVAEEVRELMAQLGFRTFEEMVGRVDRLDMRRGISHWKAQGLDFSRIFHSPDMPVQVARSWKERQDHGLEQALDHVLIAQSKTAIEQGQAVVIETGVRNVNRSVGAMLSGEVARHHGFAGLPQDTILVRAKGTAGQSFGAFLAHGVTFHLYGEANDYVGKGLSGGRIIIQPAPESTLLAEENIIVGNTVLYGAVAGECYFRGVAGERFAVRNSGAVAVVEGVGDHGCEYMTGGTVVVLGEAGRNFAAGMSGGIAFVYDEAGDFDKRCNLSMVALEAVPEEEQTTEVKGVLDTHGRVRVNHIEARDEYLLRILIENHVRYTGSTRGQQILDQWSSARSKFVKVMPLEYRRALAEMAAEQQLAQVA
ncbi:glutamate synthase large subunit [Ferrovum myxofaciens]|uniref:Glutamate synthase, large subunit n=1 Tax=mine drainage metagenome TaxID=410659 RepID=A0A3P3ZR16_9ZZZZ|nr:glutamate synthase large subunit [Ferrovum myxofaciens]MBU6994970.1 glutamate synthase large subunit [Ferrovum myxofaciens]MBW8028574.1 glutamate synthase large subunit [Ferrovum sp.]